MKRMLLQADCQQTTDIEQNLNNRTKINKQKE